MSRRIIPCSLGVAVLMLVAVALWLPVDFGSRSQAEPVSEPPTSDVKLIASEAAFFVTFRPSEFTSDDLVKAMVQDMPKSIEKELYVANYGIERLTVALVRHGTVQIVRTKKAYDVDHLNDEFMMHSRPGRFITKDKTTDKDSDTPRKPAMNEKKVGGKKIYYAGGLGRWTRGWCPIDKNTFLQGEVSALETFLRGKGKPSAEMTHALGLASTHSLVLALDGKRLRTLLHQFREDRDRERLQWQKERMNSKDKSPRIYEKDKTSSRRGSPSSRDSIFVSTRVRGAVAADDKPKSEAEEVDLLFGSLGEEVLALPYKPLLGSKFALLTLDIKKTYVLTGKIDFNNTDERDDGETALKTLLYAGRQLAGILPKHEREFKGMLALSVPLRKAFKEAKIQHKDNTLSTTITLIPEPGMAKKVREGIAEEKKKQQEERFGKGKNLP